MYVYDVGFEKSKLYLGTRHRCDWTLKHVSLSEILFQSYPVAAKSMSTIQGNNYSRSYTYITQKI